jgi:hypothetical protein
VYTDCSTAAATASHAEDTVERGGAAILVRKVITSDMRIQTILSWLWNVQNQPAQLYSYCEKNRKKSVTAKFSLDVLSVTSLASLAALCFLIFIARKFVIFIKCDIFIFLVVCVIVHASSPDTGCGCDTPDHHLLKKDKPVNISGVYLLEEVENYDNYLLALDIPERVVRNLESLK